MILTYPFMFPSLAVCLILAGIHTYFGYHIVKRGVIFVDLSLSQIAALGACIALLFGWGENAPVQSFIMSLVFTFAGAILFAFLRKSQDIVPMEALIGITYAGAIALSLLALEKMSVGTEHIKEMLVGTILTVSWSDILQLGIIVTLVTVIHWLSRKKLFMVTEEPDKASQNNLLIWWWDVVFYATFGIVVTSSVKIAGVLLIFSLLTIPAVTAIICTKGTLRRIIVGWILGVTGCILGLEFSLLADFTAGTSIIATLLFQLIICWCIRIVSHF
jgi:zinc/manganese transport system permease protein